jgi:undecaprenyl-phosphate glucose phosphotransferase
VFGKSIFKSYSGFINAFSRISDPLVVVFAAIVAYGLRFSFTDLDLPKDYRTLVVFSLFCVVLVFPLFNLYSSWRGQILFKQAKAIFSAWLSVVLLLIVILFGLKISSEYSRIWLAWWCTLGLLFLLLSRIVVYAFLQYQRKRGRNIRYVVIAGAGDLGKKVLSQVSSSPWTGYKITGFFDDNSDLIKPGIKGYRVLGAISELEKYVAKNQIDEVWIALPLRAEQRVKELLYDLRHHTVNIKLIPDIFGFSLLNHSMTEVASLPAVSLSDSPMGGGNQIIKAIEDRVLGLIFIILIIPFAFLIALGVKATSPGPILYKQKRHGWDRKIINVYKFRTMDIHKENVDEITQATKNDSRVTVFGAFLRRTSLDELPQLYNVLQGRMSLVGPRPHAVQHNELFKEKVDRYMLRHMVKPGITGWAQINGLRGETDTLEKMQKRVEYDLYYIENWSLGFDLKIIFMTILKGFVNKNAY